MATELTSMTEMMGVIFITGNSTGTNEAGQCFTTKVTETTVP
jgi:hypothetical protein